MWTTKWLLKWALTALEVERVRHNIIAKVRCCLVIYFAKNHAIATLLLAPCLFSYEPACSLLSLWKNLFCDNVLFITAHNVLFPRQLLVRFHKNESFFRRKNKFHAHCTGKSKGIGFLLIIDFTHNFSHGHFKYVVFLFSRYNYLNTGNQLEVAFYCPCLRNSKSLLSIDNHI